MSDTLLGVLCVLLFLIISNVNAVLSGWLLQQVHPFTLLFWSFLVVIIFFQVRLRVTMGKSSLRVPTFSTRNLLSLNVASSVSWIGYYYALRYIEPAIVSALMGCVGPMFIVIKNFLSTKVWEKKSFFVATGMLLGTILLVWSSFSSSGLEKISLISIAIGLLSAFIGGLGQVMTTLSTKGLAAQGWNASQIMAHRFYLLVLIVGMLAWHNDVLLVNNTNNVLPITLISIVGVLIPLWVLQKGIILSSPLTVSVLLSFSPLITLFFQKFDARLAWSSMTFVGCVVIVASVLAHFITLQGKEKK